MVGTIYVAGWYCLYKLFSPLSGREVYQEMVLRDEETPLSLYENYPKGAVR